MTVHRLRMLLTISGIVQLYVGDLAITHGMVLFAFTTILTWSFYVKQCLTYFVEKVSEDVRF